MMPPLSTPVIPDRLPVSLDFDTRLTLLGSCFSDEIGRRLTEVGLMSDPNPFGTLYNPASIASAIRRLDTGEALTEADLVERDGLFHSWHHHGRFSRPTAEATLALCNSQLQEAHLRWASTQVVMVTFGTAWVFEHEGRVVANCHKVPPDRFVRRRMGVEEIVALWRPLFEGSALAGKQVVFTVSPIRHMADGAHGNQLSKGTLLLAVERLVEAFPGKACYFPAYEIVLDELRDYRFYAADMVHPSPVAVEVVWERFCQATMSGATRNQAAINRKQYKQKQHIPIHQL